MKRNMIVVMFVMICFIFFDCSYIWADSTYYVPYEDGEYDYSYKYYYDPGCVTDEFGYDEHNWEYEKKSGNYEVYICNNCKCRKYVKIKVKKKAKKKVNVKKEKKKAKKVVTKFFKYVKKYDYYKIDNLFMDRYYDPDYPYQRRYQKVFRKINKKLKWKIKKVTKRGSTYNVKVKVKYPNLKSKIYKTANYYFKYYWNLRKDDVYYDVYESVDKEIVNTMNSNFYNATIKKKTVIFKIKKDNEKFYIKKKNKKLIDIATAGWGTAFSKAEDKWVK